jgi:hypothetical protein
LAYREDGHSTLDDGYFLQLGLLETRHDRSQLSFLGGFVAEVAGKRLLKPETA